MNQQIMSDMEYSYRKKKTRREEFLEIMDEIIPWEEWVSTIRPYYATGKHGRPPIELELILRMYLLQCWFNLSDPGTEDAIRQLCHAEVHRDRFHDRQCAGRDNAVQIPAFAGRAWAEQAVF